MDDPRHFMDQQLKQYKAAITEAYAQFHLDDDSRIAAAHHVINSAVFEYGTMTDDAQKDRQRNVISGMLSMAAACHLLSMDEIKKYKSRAEIEVVEIPFKMTF